jgi:hypothetical protein
MTVNCAVDCVNGCVLGDKCPNLDYATAASKFINDTPLDKMLEIAEEAVRKKMLAQMTQPTQWILPDDKDL